jgi:hypothetical protein
LLEKIDVRKYFRLRKKMLNFLRCASKKVVCAECEHVVYSYGGVCPICDCSLEDPALDVENTK